MRILIVDTCYEAFLDAHYASSPGLDRALYAEQWRALMDKFFGTADSYSHHLMPLGHEAHEVVANCAPLQRAWAREHLRLGRFRRLRPDEVVLRQAEWFEPDVVYVQNLVYPSDGTLVRLKEISGFLAGQIASDAPPPERLQRYDLLVTSFPHFVERFRALGVAAEYLPLAFDERILDRLHGAEPERYGAVFVGALNRTQHARGNALLERAARRTRIAFWGYNAAGWPPDSPLLTGYRGEAWGIGMYRVLRGATIALNRHIDVAEGFANNMRLYEATGVGTMLLTEEGANLTDLFEPGREVETYANEDDLVEKVEHYLAHDDERRSIALAGQRRTLRAHSYGCRMRELTTLLEAHRGAA
jgi:spore maturation protein CgeB